MEGRAARVPLPGVATATSTGYSAESIADGIENTGIHLANAYGGSTGKSVAIAAVGTVGDITGSAYGKSTAILASPAPLQPYAGATSVGIGRLTVEAGFASGATATSVGAGIGNVSASRSQ